MVIGLFGIPGFFYVSIYGIQQSFLFRSNGEFTCAICCIVGDSSILDMLFLGFYAYGFTGFKP